MFEIAKWLPVGVAVIAVIAAFKFIFRWGQNNKLPPGPRGWPVLGVMASISNLPHRDFARWAEKHGPLMSLRLGSCLTIVVSSPDMAKQFLQNDLAFASRPECTSTNIWGYDRRDVVCTPYGSYWRFLRKICSLELFTARRINQFQGLRRTQSLLLISTLLEKARHGEPVEIIEPLVHLTTNNITQMLVKKSYFGPKASSSSEAQEFGSALADCFDVLGTFDPGDYFPLLKPFDLLGTGAKMRSAHTRLDKFVQRMIDERKEEIGKLHANEENKDPSLVDTLLAMTSMKSDDGGEVDLNIMIKAFVLDLVSGGTDSSAVAVEWAMSALLKHPHAMDRVQEELDAAVGADKMVDESDIPKLPYLQAVVKETLRLYAVAPLLLPRLSREPSSIAGFLIPANTQIYINAHSIFRDPTAWKNPLHFDPSRFIGSSIDVRGNHFELIPFGAGRRMCPAVNLAMVSILNTLAHLLHACKWSLPAGQEAQDLDMTERPGLTAGRAHRLKACVSLRSPAGPYSHLAELLI
ncbi:hypothetical protein Mapa_017637 [Marchantia paleacea]|nr:hypothetical protein Mapa_017637 [Marchantia paleacea]